MPLDDQKIEALLRNAAPHLEDRGFTAGVLAALPPPRRSARPWVLLGAAAVGAFVAFVAAPGADGLVSAVRAVTTYQLGAPPPIAAITLLALVAAGAVAYATDEA